MISLSSSVEEIPKIGTAYAKKLKKFGIKTVQDLLFYFPFRYDDFSQTISLSGEYLGQTVTVAGKITKTKLNRIFRRRIIAEIAISAWMPVLPVRSKLHIRLLHRNVFRILPLKKRKIFHGNCWINFPTESMVVISARMFVRLTGSPSRIPLLNFSSQRV